jgi:hypothetical protein
VRYMQEQIRRARAPLFIHQTATATAWRWRRSPPRRACSTNRTRAAGSRADATARSSFAAADRFFVGGEPARQPEPRRPNDERRLPRQNRGRRVTRSWDAGVCLCSTRAGRSETAVCAGASWAQLRHAAPLSAWRCSPRRRGARIVWLNSRWSRGGRHARAGRR